MSRFLIKNVRIIDADTDIPRGWLVVDSGIIENFGEREYPIEYGMPDYSVDGAGAMLLPGVIDEHVHFREPGLTDKADIATESAAAAAGGVTTFFDMPNTNPPTFTEGTWEDKMRLASEKSVINYAFFIGASPDNLQFVNNADYSKIPGIKLFMGSTTGSKATDNDTFLENLFHTAPAIIAVHAEDEQIIAACRSQIKSNDTEPEVSAHTDIRSAEACYNATARITELALRYRKRLHVLHVSTASELALFQTDNITKKLITAETCPQYLFFDKSCYQRLGARIKCNPSVKENSDRIELIKAVFDGTIDTVATDHAPHLPVHKQGGALTAASGMPGIQFSLRLMLLLATHMGKSFSSVSRLMSGNPAILWGVEKRGFIKKGFFADLVLVDNAHEEIKDSSVISKCGWTPYEGIHLNTRILTTWVNGIKVFGLHEGVHHSARAASPVTFNRITQ